MEPFRLRSRLSLSPFLGQQPFVELRVIVGLGPGIVFGFGVLGVFYLAVLGFDGLNHVAGFLHRDGGVLGAVENPDGQLGQRLGIRGIATAANGDDRRETLRMRGGKRPRPVTAHAQSSQVNPALIDAVSAADVIEQRDERLVIPAASGTLGRNEDERKIRLRFHDLGRPVFFDLDQVRAGFARAVQEKHQWKSLFRFVVALGQIQKIINLVGRRARGFEMFFGLNGRCWLIGPADESWCQDTECNEGRDEGFHWGDCIQDVGINSSMPEFDLNILRPFTSSAWHQENFQNRKPHSFDPSPTNCSRRRNSFQAIAR